MPAIRSTAFLLTLATVAVPAASLAHGHDTNPYSRADAVGETLVAKAAATADFSTLVTALRAADLVGTLRGAGPFTVFAPPNAAFDRLPRGTVATLVQPQNQKALRRILTYHVVAQRLNATDIVNLVRAGGGQATLRTVGGHPLIARYNANGQLVLIDATGGQSRIAVTDIAQSNGVIHVIDRVLMPS